MQNTRIMCATMLDTKVRAHGEGWCASVCNKRPSSPAAAEEHLMMSRLPSALQHPKSGVPCHHAEQASLGRSCCSTGLNVLPRQPSPLEHFAGTGDPHRSPEGWQARAAGDRPGVCCGPGCVPQWLRGCAISTKRGFVGFCNTVCLPAVCMAACHALE